MLQVSFSEDYHSSLELEAEGFSGAQMVVLGCPVKKTEQRKGERMEGKGIKGEKGMEEGRKKKSNQKRLD